MKNKGGKRGVVIYQTKSGGLELKGDFSHETIWATQDQIAQLFNTTKQNVGLHLKNIFKSGELSENSVVKDFFTTARDGKQYRVKFYNVDAIISVGYRVNSTTATQFRQWATKTLREHITKGFTINKKRLAKNYEQFLTAVEQVKKLLPSGGVVDAQSTLELVKLFAGTWLSLDAYDKASLPTTGVTKKQVRFTATDLDHALKELRHELIRKGEATELFGTERSRDSVAGILGNVFQSFGGKDVYPTAEEKAAHILYFIIKNHPFVDGNKRSGAFAFVWFLRRAKLLDLSRITPEALTALTLLVAESNSKDKSRMIGLVLLLLKK
jgi:prophage maintenance system killer protein